MSEMNPSVAAALDGLSSDIAGAIGQPPPMNGARPPPPQFVPPPEKPMSPTQQKQVLAEATSMKGYSTLASKKFSQLAALMPGADRVRVRKRRQDGSIATISDYNYRDVEQSGDIEAFIRAYLCPIYGGGDYEMALLDGAGQEKHAGIARFWGAPKDPDTETKAAPPADPAAGMMPLMIEMYRNTTKPPPDTFQQMRQMKEFLAMDQKPTDNSPFLAMMQMQAQQAQMQMQAQQESTKMMMAMFAQKPQDDGIKQLLDRMDRRLEKLETAPPPPPPSMPMAPSGPNTAELLTAIGGLAASIVPLIKGDGVKATEMASLIIQAQQAAKPQDTLGVKDVIAIFQDKEARQSPPATLEEQIGTLIRVKEIAGALAPQQPQGPQGTTFWDALVTLFGNGDFAKAIGSRVDQGMAPKQIEVTSRPVPDKQLSENASPTQQPAQEEPKVQMPPDFAVKCKAIEDAVAVGPGAQIEATVAALMSLREVDQWKAFLQSFLLVTAKGDKEDAKRHLGSWFKLLMTNQMLTREAALATLKTFDMAFPMVREGLLEKLPAFRAVAQQADAERAAVEAAKPQPAPVQAAPEAVVTPAPAAEVPDLTEVEIPTGPPPVHVDIGDADAAAYSSHSL